MSQTIERTALTQLVTNEKYARKVLPFMKGDYFSDKIERTVLEEIIKFVDKYNKIPTQTSLEIEVQGRKDLNEEEYKKIVAVIQTLNSTDVDFDWLVDTTEQFCKDKAVYNAIVEGISIIDGKDKNRGPDSIPNILTDALAVGFDNSVGHDYLVDSESRFDYYHKIEEKIPFDLEFFNKITKGGLPPKTLNIALAGTGVGKSLFMCHVAANCLSQGKNVLYITLEMAEERIAERIDANLMNISMEDLHDLPKQMFDNKIANIIKSTSGKLIVKEYPTASAHSGHFRGLIKELAIKKSFKSDIIFIDYLNICSSSRFKGATNVNSYMYIKAIAEELRGLAVETNVPIMSATQTTRSGFVSSDIGLEDTSESFGLPATADLMFALISSEELDELNQIAVKQLKNRYNDPTINKRFVVGLDRAKMKLFDIKLSEQNNIVDSGQEDFVEPVFDKSDFGDGWQV
ncbi:MAG: DnaB-like helicase C-terminal domain-containing protein [Candidatus Pacebacteria bacterium]|jgi:archaellum biogenesis ATPase FlaH|nr:DnaB-like helicase C-terminal domain-containing protein [Candidatus Paceibacterota bacterium]